MAQLTKSELTILKALIADSNGQGQFEHLRRTAKLSHRGFRLVWGRMAERNLVGWTDEPVSPTITFGGVRALRAVGVPA